MNHKQLPVLSSTQLGDGFFKLTFPWRKEQAPQPGQFLTLRVSALPYPLLRRPFAFSHFDPARQTASIVVKKRGIATDILSRKKPGETVDVIGPLGNSFKDPEAGRSALLLAGGIGLGPMLFFASHLEERNQSYSLVFGCRSDSAIPQCEDLRELQAVLCTDDGSMGFGGTTVDYLTSLYPNHMKRENTELYCCGPHAMLSAASRFAHQKGIPCWVSMEQTMGCSMGACMGCVIPLSREPGFARVCTEGPIFNSEEVSWT